MAVLRHEKRWAIVLLVLGALFLVAPCFGTELDAVISASHSGASHEIDDLTRLSDEVAFLDLDVASVVAPTGANAAPSSANPNANADSNANASTSASTAGNSGSSSTAALKATLNMLNGRANGNGNSNNGRMTPAAPYQRKDICYKWERVRSTANEGFAPRFGHHAWLSADSSSVLVFGGCDVPRGASRHLEHCRTGISKFDLLKQTWQSMPFVGPTNEPANLAIEGSAAATDPHSGVLYVFGGRRKTYSADSPQQVAFSNSLDTIAKRRAQFAPKPQDNKKGGNATSAPAIEEVFTVTHLETSGDVPPPMAGAQLVYGHAELILFGGFSDEGFFNDVYTIALQGVNAMVWKKVKLAAGSPVPPARRGHTLTRVFPERSQGPIEFVLFGGSDGTKTLNDVWFLRIENGVYSWAQRDFISEPNVYPPSPRSGHAAEFQNGRLFIFGGCDTTASPAVCYDDVHILNLMSGHWEAAPESLAMSNYAQGNSTTALLPPRAPNARRGAVALAIHKHNKIILVGGCTMTSCPGHTRALPTWQTRQEILKAKQRDPSQANDADEEFEDMDSGVGPDGTPRKLIDAGSVFIMNTDAICPTSCSADGGVYVEETPEDDEEPVTNDNYIGPHCKCTPFSHGKFCQNKYDCPNGCSGDKGECVHDRGISYCRCKPGWWGIDCATAACRNNCNGRGVCTVGPNPLIASKTTAENAKRIQELLLGLSDQAKAAAKDLWMRSQSHCACREGYYGRDCSLERKPFSSHEDRCPNQCSGHGLCDTSGKCQCQQGFAGPACDIQCPNLCSGNGVCRADGICECREGFTGADCNQPTCPNDCSKNGKCVNGICKCAPGFGGRACQLATDCSGKGSFVDGKCICKPGWGGEDCSREVVCEGGCGANGRCVEPYPSPDETRLLGKPVTTFNGPSLIELEVDTSGKPKAEEAAAGTRKDRFARPIRGVCQCVNGWRGKNCNLRVCKHECQNGFCSEDGACMCYPGWKGEACTIPAPCPGNCTSAAHGICQATGVCVCKNGWGGPDCGVPGCPNDCSGNGECRKGHCYCKKGFSGLDCSQRCLNDCHGRGECVNGKCQCYPGFEGADCNDVSHCPRSLTSTLDCSGHGFCNRAEKKCICEPGWKGADCSIQEETCDNNKCGEHGVCRNGRCYCDVGYSGKNCEILNKCPDNCNGRGYCNFGRCHCYNGFEGPACERFVGDETCPNKCSGHGFCMYGRCFCQDGFGGEDCSQPTGFCATTNCNNNGECRFGKCFCYPGSSGKHCELGGCQPRCEPGKGRCILGQCHCNPGFTGPSCSQSLTCPGNCSGKGVCILGSCACLPGYTGRDCSVPIVTDHGVFPQSCPDNCSGHGVCRDGKCICAPGFDGLNCAIEQEAVCPNNCGGDRGVCRYGKCFCKPGYDGPGCERDLQCHPECFKNGVCLYGKCHCLPGFAGPDCKTDLAAQQTTAGLSDSSQVFAIADPRDKELMAELKKQEALGTRNGTSFLDTRTTIPRIADASSVFAVAATTASEKSVEIALPDALSSISKPCGPETHGCSQRGICVNGKCQCELGYAGPDCSMVLGGQLWHRCPQACNNRGLCLFGRCYCDLGYGGRSCEHTLDISCKNNCSGNGICSYGKCHCMPGFVGPACETKVPCDVDCGAHGVCFRGRCICAHGYAGKHCQYPASYAGVENEPLEAKGDVDPTVFSGFIESEDHAEEGVEEVSVVDSTAASPNLVTAVNLIEVGAQPAGGAVARTSGSPETVAIIPAAEETAALVCPHECARGRCIAGRCYCEPGFAGEQCHIVVDPQLVGPLKLAESQALVQLTPFGGDWSAHPLFVVVLSIAAGMLVSYYATSGSRQDKSKAALARSLKKFADDM